MTGRHGKAHKSKRTIRRIVTITKSSRRVDILRFTFYVLHLEHLELMSSLFMYHTLRMMVDTTGLDVCLGLTEEQSVTDRSWSWELNQNPSTYVAPEEVQVINDKLGKIDQKLNILVAGHMSGDDDDSNGPVAKSVSFCSPLCSFLSS